MIILIILVCSGEDWRFWWTYCFLTGWCNVLLLREFKGSFLWWCGRGEDWWQGCGLLLAEWCRRRLGRLGSVLAVRQLDVNVVVTELTGNAEAVICLTHPAVASSWEEVSHSTIQVSMRFSSNLSTIIQHRDNDNVTETGRFTRLLWLMQIFCQPSITFSVKMHVSPNCKSHLLIQRIENK